VTVRSKAEGRPIAKAMIHFLWPDIERRFDTEANGVALVEGVRPREHVFEARADGYAVEVATVAATQPGTTNNVDFLLAPGGQIRGTVRDAEGQPIARVGVTLQRAGNPAALRVGYLKTDNDGRFFFDNVPLGETLEISVGRQNQWKRKTLILGSDQKNVTADVAFDKPPESGSIVVHVTGPDRKPIAGAELSNPGSSSQWWRRGTTDAEGNCRIDRVYDFAGRYRLFVRAKGFAPFETSFKPGTSAHPVRVEIELAAGHTLRGRVMLTNGKPAANLRVFFGGGEFVWTTGGETTTDAEGRFALDSLPANCTFTIYPPAGYAPFRGQRLALDRNVESIITLDTAALVRGRVIDAVSGKPAIPYRIRIMGSTNFRQGEPWPMLDTRLRDEGQVILRPDGKFEFGDLPPGAPMQLMISSKGYVDQSLDRVIAKPDDRFEPLEFRLRKIEPRDLRAVSGTLVDAAGKPVARVELRLWTTASKPVDLSQHPFNWSMIQLGQLEQSPQCQQFLSLVTGKHGEFDFPNVRIAGYGELAYWGKGIAPGRHPVRLTHDSEPVVKLTVQAVAPARIVVEIDRKAWPKAGQVQLFGQSRALFGFGDRYEAIAGEKHRFTFDDLPAGQVSVLLNDSGRDLGNNSIQFQTLKNQMVTLKPGETVTVRFDKP
jgi:hypothetical protein